MLERVWRKGNPLTLLVGMQTSTATMENSVEIPYVFLNKEILNIWQKKPQNKTKQNKKKKPSLNIWFSQFMQC